MSDEMQTHAIDITTQALDRFNIETPIAASINKDFDKKYNALPFQHRNASSAVRSVCS
jgi:hypothetical protein